ncbi:MAG: single-stranded-DNA-specific exonuclease RecJ, partial [Gemmatimonadaceae bacterium]|nr:single-stranded-DNA-specific exonuclease RecJ [Gemmatimonadaceae bacterium]
IARRKTLLRARPAAAPEGAALAASLGLPALVGSLLIARGHGTTEHARQFLRPQLEQLHAPELFAGMSDAVARLSTAIRAGERILVHGDYDVDGMCSTALLVRSLRALGGDVEFFIPDRRTDGYDLGSAGVAAATREGARVVLTADCGTTAIDAAEALAAAGIDLIITDHHLPGPALPRAVAILNPRRADCPSEDKEHAAVGMAFKLALALTRALGGNEAVVFNQLDLVALATVADVAQLRGENRVFVRRGLALMKETKSAGLAALLRSSGLDAKPLTAGRLGYILAPRLNALGRLASAMDGVRLLLADDPGEANELARRCEEHNRARQETDRAILAEAMARVERLDLATTKGIVLAGDGWHPGVIGIVASRVVEATGRPTLLIAVEQGIGKGSGRSIGAFDLHEALEACGDLLLKHGGHRAAAGLTIDAAQIPAFTERFAAVAAARLSDDDLVPELRIDLEVDLDEVTDDLERALRHLEPFGVGNPGPVFAVRGAEVQAGARKIGTDGVKFTVAQSSGPIEAVAWGMADRAAMLKTGARVDLAFRVERDDYRGADRVRLGVVDVRGAE